MTEPEAAALRGPWHYGRGWPGTEIEDGCPCDQAPCGLVTALLTPGGACEQHTIIKSIRQSHPADQCPGRRDEDVQAAAIAQADARRALAELVPQPDPTSQGDLLRERLGRQVARRAEERGQLDVGGQ